CKDRAARIGAPGHVRRGLIFVRMDFLGPLSGLAERFFGKRERRREAETQIADKALALRRSLVASYAHCPNGPASDAEYISWATQVNNGFRLLDPALKELEALRAAASPKVSSAVERARDSYYKVGDLVTPLF